MLKILLKKQLMEVFRAYFYNQKKNERRSTGSTVMLFVMFILLVVVVLGGVFGGLAYAICAPLQAAGMGWLYFTLMELLAIAMGTFGSVFNTYSGLYLSKDNDLLLSMPIPVGAIISSRLLSVYLLGLLYSGIISLPAAVVYWISVPLTPGGVVGPLVMVVLVSLVVLVLSCVLGYAVARISLKLKNKSFITVLLALVFFGAYYFFYFKAQTMIQKLVENAAVYGARIKGSAYPLYAFGCASEGAWLPLLGTAAVVAILCALTWLLLSRSFLRVATATGRVGKKVYTERTAQVHSVPRALLGKELSRFTTSPNYMLNCGLGVLLLPILAVLTLIKGGEIGTVINEIFGADSGVLPVLFCTAICLGVSMCDMTAPSVSLEGKTLWLLQSLPVRPWQVLQAKLRLQLLLTGIPVALCVLCALIVTPLTAAQIAPFCLLPLLYTLFSALLGLYLGLKMPNLTWTNELIPIKQSGPVMIVLFGGWGYALLLAGGYLLLASHLDAALYMTLFSLLTAVPSLLLYRWLKKQGSVRFAAL